MSINAPRALALIAAIGLVGLVACSNDPAPSPSPTASESPTEPMTGGTFPITGDENGKTITLSIGQSPFLRLEFTPGAGDSWVVVDTPDEAVVKITGEEDIAPEEPMPGAPSEHMWTFEAVGEGTTTFKAEKQGPSNEVRATYEITFEVTAA